MKIAVELLICRKLAEKEDKVCGVERSSLSSDRHNPD
jgi:hypothetical protein